MMKSKITIVWVVTVALFLISTIFDIQVKIACVLPFIFILASFLLVKKHPVGYRIFHLIVNVQIFIYYLFQLALNYESLLPSERKFNFMSDMQIDAIQFAGYAYIFFIILYFLVYTPYYFIQTGKADK